jgi:hypothetical protein
VGYDGWTIEHLRLAAASAAAETADQEWSAASAAAETARIALFAHCGHVYSSCADCAALHIK